MIYMVTQFVAPTSCLAWGVEGHEIIAHVAARELTSSARAQVQGLLGGDVETALVEVSSWADEIRQSHPNTAPWHYVDIPLGSGGDNAGRDCQNGDCVVAQIDRERTVLADRRVARPLRAEALRFLIHFVGDLHQPLHAADNGDRGGNEVRISLGGRLTNLHAAWDTALVEALGRDPITVSGRLMARITPADRKNWQTGNATNWANETFRVASTEIYAKLRGSGGTTAPVILPGNYAASESTAVSTQLERAGVRLAAVLNAALR